ncbi:MAG TPA: ATP-binding protein [Anaerolineales bacterium]|nr:ATP-binding protein [Anaerolineales bacterium]
MRPPISDLGLMAELLAITAMISAAAGYMAYRFGWMDRSPAIRSTLIGGYLLSSLLTLLNVGVTAWLMFTSLHDLYLAMVLLVFAGGIAIVFGVYYTSALSNRIKNLDLIARDLAQGNLQARAPTSGRDEIAALGNTFNDMAQQLQAAAEKQRQIDLLRRDLIAWVGHDLRTPLASVRAVLEALADGVIEDPESVQRYLGTARRDINALSELIDDLFEMSQIDAGGLKLNREDSSLTDLISDTLESFSELAARQKVTLEGQAGPNLDPVWMDTLKIGRVLNNLVSNALTYTPPGGTVRLIAQRRSREIEVMVEDNGSGIAPQDLPTIFDRFTRGEKSRSRSTGGAGLGLAIARGIVEAHGGQIKVESAPGQATHFSFTIPNRQKDGTNR